MHTRGMTENEYAVLDDIQDAESIEQDGLTIVITYRNAIDVSMALESFTHLRSAS